MKKILLLFVLYLPFMSCSVNAESNKKTSIRDISHLISKDKFKVYKDVADFIDDAPKVTITVNPSAEEIKEYGQDFMKSLTGSDCDRDGKMDDNATCNAVFYKLWVKYSL